MQSGIDVRLVEPFSLLRMLFDKGQEFLFSTGELFLHVLEKLAFAQPGEPRAFELPAARLLSRRRIGLGCVFICVVQSAIEDASIESDAITSVDRLPARVLIFRLKRNAEFEELLPRHCVILSGVEVGNVFSCVDCVDAEGWDVVPES